MLYSTLNLHSYMVSATVCYSSILLLLKLSKFYFTVTDLWDYEIKEKSYTFTGKNMCTFSSWPISVLSETTGSHALLCLFNSLNFLGQQNVILFLAYLKTNPIKNKQNFSSLMIWWLVFQLTHCFLLIIIISNTFPWISLNKIVFLQSHVPPLLLFITSLSVL